MRCAAEQAIALVRVCSQAHRREASPVEAELLTRSHAELLSLMRFLPVEDMSWNDPYRSTMPTTRAAPRNRLRLAPGFINRLPRRGVQAEAAEQAFGFPQDVSCFTCSSRHSGYSGQVSSIASGCTNPTLMSRWSNLQWSFRHQTASLLVSIVRFVKKEGKRLRASEEF